MLDKLMDQLGKDLAIDAEIKKSENHHYHVPFENGIEVEVAELKQGCLLKGVIGDRPLQNGEAFLLKAMEANLFGIGTRGAVMGLKENGNKLTLSLEVDYNISYKEFKDKLEDFISVLDFWRQEALKHE